MILLYFFKVIQQVTWWRHHQSRSTQEYQSFNWIWLAESALQDFPVIWLVKLLGNKTLCLKPCLCFSQCVITQSSQNHFCILAFSDTSQFNQLQRHQYGLSTLCPLKSALKITVHNRCLNKLLWATLLWAMQCIQRSKKTPRQTVPLNHSVTLEKVKVGSVCTLPAETHLYIKWRISSLCISTGSWASLQNQAHAALHSAYAQGSSGPLHLFPSTHITSARPVPSKCV